MKTTTEEKWAERVAAWRASGKSPDEFAAKSGIKSTTLRWWASYLNTKRPRAVRAATPPRVVRVVSKPQVSNACPIVVRVGGAEVVLERGFDRELLNEVVAALRGTR